MRLRVAVVAVVCGLLAAAGCTGDGEESTSESSTVTEEAVAPTLPATAAPASTSGADLPAASAAGGACTAMSFDEVAVVLGIRFEVAAASTSGETRSCALQELGSTGPHLAFSVTPAGDGLTVENYKTDYVPAGANAQSGIGKASYLRVLKAAAGAGPRVELGWLGEKNLYTLSLTTSSGTTTAKANAFGPKLVQLGTRLVN